MENRRKVERTMVKNTADIRTVLDIDEWEKVQDQLAKLTGTAIITIDYKGNPVSRHSGRTDFCTVIRENPVSRKRCYKCDALAGLEAVRNDKPFIYLCHCGIVDVAVPVMLGDRYLGAVMFGQVRVPSDDTDAKVEHLVNEISTFEAENETAREDLLEMYNRLPLMEYQRVVEIADLVNSLVRYIAGRTARSMSEKLEMEYLLNAERIPSFDGGTAGDAVLDDLNRRSRPPRQGDYTRTDLPEEEVTVSSPVYPAVSYIFNHRGEMPTMTEMANLCHLSPSYFSRVFLRELGENYTDYLHRVKVVWAKELLPGPQTVGQIALQLGYQDSSYFVKVFKKYEGVTPTGYVRSLRRR